MARRARARGSQAATPRAHRPTPTHPTPPLQRLLDLSDHISIEEFFEGWFHGAPIATIKRDNVEEFIAYGFHCARLADLTDEERCGVTTYVARVEAKYGQRFGPGRNPDVRFMAHLWEPLRVLHKPLALHALAEVMRLATDGALWAAGFESGVTACGFRYWIKKGATASSDHPPSRPASAPAFALSTLGGLARRRAALRSCDSASSLDAAATGGAPSTDPDSAPILFVHGVGLGLTPYLPLILELSRLLPGRPVVLLEARHVSVGLAARAASTDQVADAARAVLASHGWASAACVGHSYGTFVLSRLAQAHPATVQSLVLLDPVCMLTIYPQLLQNFVYKPPTMAAGTRAALAAVDSARFLFSRDLVVAEAFCRRFAWHRECLWPQDSPDGGRTLLALAAADDLVPSALVRRVLAASRPDVRVAHHPTAGHGGILLHHRWRKEVLAAAADVIRTGAAHDRRVMATAAAARGVVVAGKYGSVIGAQPSPRADVTAAAA
jgi:pimeloyl-ACP methyl ester carboxylesterase